MHDALDALAAEDSVAAEVVKLRYFVGMTIPEIADALELSRRARRSTLGLRPRLAQAGD